MRMLYVIAIFLSQTIQLLPSQSGSAPEYTIINIPDLKHDNDMPGLQHSDIPLIEHNNDLTRLQETKSLLPSNSSGRRTCNCNMGNCWGACGFITCQVLGIIAVVGGSTAAFYCQFHGGCPGGR